MNEKSILTGTIAELLTMGITVNGHPVDNAQLSVLTRLFGKPIEKIAAKGGSRGRKSTIWELDSNMALNLSVATVNVARTTVEDAEIEEENAETMEAVAESVETLEASPEDSTVEVVEPVESVAVQEPTEDNIAFPWDSNK